MSSSLFEGLVRSQAAQWVNYAPVDTAWSRAILSNAAHIADSSAQVVAAWRSDANPVIRDRDAAENELGVRSSDYVVWASQLFNLRFRPDGSSYRIRIRVRAATDSGTASTIRAIVYGPSTVISPLTGNERVVSWTFSSTTAAWLTSPTGGDGNGNVYIPNAAECFADRSTPASLGGTPSSLRYTQARVRLWVTPASDTVEIYGVSIAEYIGT